MKTIQCTHPPHHRNGFVATCRLWTDSGGVCPVACGQRKPVAWHTLQSSNDFILLVSRIHSISPIEYELLIILRGLLIFFTLTLSFTTCYCTVYTLFCIKRNDTGWR